MSVCVCVCVCVRVETNTGYEWFQAVHTSAVDGGRMKRRDCITKDSRATGFSGRREDELQKGCRVRPADLISVRCGRLASVWQLRRDGEPLQARPPHIRPACAALPPGNRTWGGASASRCAASWCRAGAYT